MSATRFGRVEALFDEVVAAPSAARSALLAERCPNPTLRREVQALVDAHERLATGGPPPGASVDLAPGAAIGAYRVAAKIGEGGMGAVYRATRADGAFDRDVAIKVMLGAGVGPRAAERFARERQILASLQHPGIVTLLDGGVTPDGRLYLVMELVEGEPVTRYCDGRQLSLADRLALVRRVAEAVEYAHRRAVVHRDLKPANVLVTRDGLPKVLDFGVATLLTDGRVAEPTALLLPAPLTPNYASPEQLRGLAVTTASDVYALGVLLYEVVCGERPYETHGLPLDELLDVATVTEPPVPSRRLGTRALGTPPFTGRHLRGDVDAIVQKALQKDPGQRYQSPRDLADDLGRLARRQPVGARPPSAGYLVRRFIARHRAGVAAAGAAAALVVAAFGVAVWQWREARAEQQRAERRFEDVRHLATKVLFDYQESLRLLRGASDLRARMAADSLAYLDALAGEGADDGLQLETARGYLAVAEVQGNTRANSVGDAAGAMRSLDKARALLDDLVRRRPTFRPAVEARAQFGCTAARIDTARARRHARECLSAVAPLVAGLAPHHPLVIRQGEAHMLLVEAGELDHAAAALAVYGSVMDHPRVGSTARLNVGLVHRLVGRAVLARDPARAKAEGADALAAIDPAVRAAPQATRMELAFTLQLIGQADVALGRRDEGRAALEQAVSLARAAYRDNPNDAFLQDRVISAWFQLALAMDGVDRDSQARAARGAVSDLPAMTLRLGASERDRARGYLLAVHARLGFATTPCDVVARAHQHFLAAPGGATADRRVRAYATWAADAEAACRAPVSTRAALPAERAVEPGAGKAPVAFDGGRSDLQHGGRLFDR